nr:hypothetical protein [Desulfobacula sp.]
MNKKDWKKLIPGCFAGMDAPFGIHPNDEKRAIKMLHLALCQGAKMPAVIKEAEKHLKKYSSSKKFIDYQIDLIKSFKPNPFKSRINKSRAWLITWEKFRAEEENDQSNKIVSIFDSRVSSDKIKDYAENFFISTQYSPFEKITFANKRKNNPYPAEYLRINGIQWQGRIVCGHNPYLLARLVKNLIVVNNESGQEIISWEEQPIPKDLSS